ncbi:MAG: hypothetical protein IJC99_04810 [Clostridia bacterium]|nr:hypothetical protein [Clostridia bacterium]
MQHNKKAAKRRFAPAAKDEVSFAGILKSAGLALLIAGGIGILLLLLFSALLLRTKNPGGLVDVAALVALALTALSAGFAATRLYRRRLPLFCGLATGALLLLLLIALALLMPRAGGGILRTLCYAAVPCLSVLGAWLGAGEKAIKKRPKRRF